MRPITMTCEKCKQRIPSGPNFPQCPCTRSQPNTEPVADQVLLQAIGTYYMHKPFDLGKGREAAAAVIASALEEARREALAPRGAFAVTETVSGGQWSAALHFGPDAEAMRAFADAVRSALKENPNAG